METTVLNYIQGQIHYNFKNQDLLRQAFTRRSYTEEHGGENNEILEFIGDKVLDFAVVKFLIQKYETTKQNDKFRFFRCDCNEDELTQQKIKLVQKKALSKRIDELDFAGYLIMGKGDKTNNIEQNTSVKEDLFEAIIGAVALDCDWDLKTIQSVAEAMLAPFFTLLDETETNYVRLIHEFQMRDGTVPFFKYKEASRMSHTEWWFDAQEETRIISQNLPHAYSNTSTIHSCKLKLRDTLPVFRGFGNSISEARMEVCKLAYEYLKEKNLLHTICDEIKNPNKDDAINQLEILARRGYFSIPTYDFEKTYDSNGNPLWKTVCHIPEKRRSFSSVASSKKDAKKCAALKMLQHILNEQE